MQENGQAPHVPQVDISPKLDIEFKQMASIGEELKRERELKGISLQEISDSTKVNISFLQALEQDEFNRLPGSFFTKGIIRTYAHYVGIDEKQILDSYLESMKRQSPGGDDKKTPGETGNRKIYIGLFLSVFTVIAILVGFFILVPGKKPLPPPELQSIPRETRHDVILPPPPEPEKKSEALDIEITFHQETWIQVFADGEMRLDGIMLPGKIFQTQAGEELILNLGNAGGFTYTINDVPGKALGKPGAVVKDIRITLENQEQFLEGEADRTGDPAPS